MISRPGANPTHDEVKIASFIVQKNIVQTVVKGSNRRLSSQQRRQWQSTEPKNTELHNENTLTQLHKQSPPSLSLPFLLQIFPTSCLGFSALQAEHSQGTQRGDLCQAPELAPASCRELERCSATPGGVALLKPLLGLQGFGQKCSISSNHGEQLCKDKGHLKSSSWVSLWKKPKF